MSMMLMAYGPNDLQIPCRLFLDREQAEAFIRTWMTSTFVHLWEGAPPGRRVWRVNDPEDAAEAGFYTAIFTAYYGGCGEATAFEILEVPVNAPFLKWNLD